MAEAKDRNQVDATSEAYDRMLPNWQLVTTLMGGTSAMRAAGEQYMPRHEAETAERYKERLLGNCLSNYFAWTVEQLAGKPFTEEITLKDDVKEPVRVLMEDCDLQGNALQPFAYQWFRLGIWKGMAHVLVDQQIGAEKEDGSPRTVEDDRRDGLRPYWVLIDPTNLICAMVEMVRGKEVLTHVRIRENYTVRDGFAEATLVQIRVLEPGTWAIYRERVSGKEKQWYLYASGTTGLAYIPLVTFYTKRVAPMESEPPLVDLAYLNVTHWQSSSDQRNVLTVARFPILAASGVPVDDAGNAKVTLGPHKYFATEDPQGKFYYVEHTGAAIEAGRNDLKDLEEQMGSYGADMLTQEPGDPTATAAALDTAEDATPLQRMVMGFRDSVELALSYTAEMLNLGEDQGGSVVIDYDPAADVGGPTDLDSIIKLRAVGDISRTATLAEFKRRNVLADDFDAEADAKLLEKEAPMGLLPEEDHAHDPNDPTDDPNDPAAAAG